MTEKAKLVKRKKKKSKKNKQVEKPIAASV